MSRLRTATRRLLSTSRAVLNETSKTHPALVADPPAVEPRDPWKLKKPPPPPKPQGPLPTLDQILSSPHPEGRDLEEPELLRKRLVYESRKRGILEMDLILATFAKERLADMNERQLREYDRFLTLPDWSIYYYVTDPKTAPEPWKESWILQQLIEHAQNHGKQDPEHPAALICELCKLFYGFRWNTGTGGGISIRKDDHVYIAPSGVQKERMNPEDIFVLTRQRDFLRWPVHKPLKQSACTPLFFNAYDMRNAGACIHTHSQHAVLATMLWKGNEFSISRQEMIKGMRVAGTGKAMSYLDTLVIPIIENTPDEEDLREGMEKAMKDYPDAPAVLVRNHGTYSWGATWESAKAQAECLDYLLELAVKIRQLEHLF